MKLKRIYYTARTSMMALGMTVTAWSAVPLAIDNPGFEGPTLADGATLEASPPGGSAIPGTSWIPFFSDPPGDVVAVGYTGAGGIINPDAAYGFGGAAFGGSDNFAYCYSYTYSYDGYVYNYDNGLRQVLTDVLAEGVYTLSVQVGNPAAKNGALTPNYRVSLYTENEVLLATATGAVPAGDTWTQVDVVYDYGAAPQPAELGVPLEIRIYAADSGQSGPEVAFDDVSLTFAPTNPVAVTGGPYSVPPGGDLVLDGSGSFAADGETLTDPTSYEWDLNDDGVTDVTGATPAAISEATLMAAPYNWVKGVNYPIKLTVTDSGLNVAESSTTGSLVPDLLIYEPFDDLDSPLNGNTAGLGLSGTWGPGESNIEPESLIYGPLAYSGGRVVTNPGDQFDVSGVSPGNTLLDAGLLDDGATLWFSCLIVKAAKVSSSNDRRIYVSLGTGTPDGFDRIGGNSGSGLCVAVNKTGNNGVEARGWNDGSDGSGGAFTGGNDTSVADGATFLAVGKITWGAFGTPGSDVFELYLPDQDLNLGSPVSTLVADFDQKGTSDPANLFDTIGIAGGRPQNFVPEVDEIRFGGTYSSVTPLDMTPPEIVSTDPVDGDPAGNSAVQVATFNEPIFVGAGDIRIVNDTDTVTTTIPVGDPQIVVSGNTLTITPTTPLLGGKAYHIEIDAGAVTNYNLIGFGGISDPTVWNFIADGTPPTLTSITDDVSPLPLLTATSVTYTVTFDEPIDASTVTTADFGNGGSAGVTVDSVTPTGDPAVFEVLVSAVSAGDLTLEIVASAVITDLSGNALDTTSAIPDDTTIAVNDPVPTGASTLVDFQATIASEQHPVYPNEARYFHVSVNPNNPGTGSYCATLVGTNDPAPRFVRNYTGPVEAYWFGGGANSVLNAGMTGGNTGILSFTTEDDTFDGFGQGQAKVWDASDPGADLATSGPGTGDSDLPYIASADKNSGLWRSLGGATGTVDISGLASGSLHIYYGAFGATPSVKVTMRDTDNVAADIVIADAHLNGDAANRSEYYLAEIDFVTDGFYDEIEFVWLANGTDYNGNGRGFGLVVTGPDVAADPFVDWAATGTLGPVTFEGDTNGDGVQDGIAFLLGVANPDDDANGALPSVTEDGSGGLQLSFDCLPTADRGTAELRVEHSSDLGVGDPWTATTDQVPDADDAVPDNGVTFLVTPGSPTNAVTATIGAAEAAGGKLFGRLTATE